jgi:hypothetical protein
VLGRSSPEVPSGEEDTVSTPESPAAAPPRRSDRSPWNWLLIVPVVVPLLVPLYNHRDPDLFGWPFFYWVQLVFVALGVVTTGLVYRMTRRSKADQAVSARAADRATHDGGR